MGGDAKRSARPTDLLISRQKESQLHPFPAIAFFPRYPLLLRSHRSCCQQPWAQHEHLCLFSPRCREGGSEGLPPLPGGCTAASERHDSFLPCRVCHCRNPGLTLAIPVAAAPAHPGPRGRLSELSWEGWSTAGGGSVALAACLLSVGKTHRRSTRVGKLPVGCRRIHLVQLASWKAGLGARVGVQQ